jgi:hypothetical protein
VFIGRVESLLGQGLHRKDLQSLLGAFLLQHLSWMILGGEETSTLMSRDQTGLQKAQDFGAELVFLCGSGSKTIVIRSERQLQSKRISYK